MSLFTTVFCTCFCDG